MIEDFEAIKKKLQQTEDSCLELVDLRASNEELEN